MLVMGFDFGMRHIGVAIGQKVTLSARPLCTVAAKNGVPNWDELAELVKTWQPQALIVGVPESIEGAINVKSKAEKFAKELERFSLPVYTVNERLTTKEARQQLFDAQGYKALKKKSVDSFAAKLILESWLRLSPK